MALEDEVNNDDSIFEFTFEELYDAFNDLLCDFKKLSRKNKELKKENQILSKDKTKMGEDIKELQIKQDESNEKNESL